MDMKRPVTLLLAMLMLLSLAACGEGGLSLKPGARDSNGGKGRSASGDDLIYPDEDGFALGYEGDTLRTEFFDMTISDPYTCDEFDGLYPDAGNKFLAVELTLYNYTGDVQPMMDIDFEALWDMDDENAWAWPEVDTTIDANGEAEYSARSDKQLPVEYDLGIHKTVTGTLLYQVPADSEEYFIVYQEVYAPEEGSDESTYGDSFYVCFSE